MHSVFFLSSIDKSRVPFKNFTPRRLQMPNSFLSQRGRFYRSLTPSKHC